MYLSQQPPPPEGARDIGQRSINFPHLKPTQPIPIPETIQALLNTKFADYFDTSNPQVTLQNYLNVKDAANHIQQQLLSPKIKEAQLLYRQIHYWPEGNLENLRAQVKKAPTPDEKKALKTQIQEIRDLKKTLTDQQKQAGQPYRTWMAKNIQRLYSPLEKANLKLNAIHNGFIWHPVFKEQKIMDLIRGVGTDARLSQELREENAEKRQNPLGEISGIRQSIKNKNP